MSACAALALLDLKPMDRVQVRFYSGPARHWGSSWMYVRRTCSGLVIAASPDGIEYSVAPEDIENIEVRDGFCVRARESGDTDRFDLSVVCAGAYAHKRGGIDRFILVDGQGSLVFGNASTWLLHSEDRKRMIALAHRGEMPVRNLWRRATASAVAAGQWGSDLRTAQAAVRRFVRTRITRVGSVDQQSAVVS